MELSLPPNTSSYRMFREDWTEGELTSVEDPKPTRVSLSASRPNPFRKTTEMFVSVPGTTSISLRILDLQGREIRDVARAVPEGAGTYRVHVDLSGFPAGVYLCRVTTSLGEQTRRIVHLN